MAAAPECWCARQSKRPSAPGGKGGERTASELWRSQDGASSRLWQRSAPKLSDLTCSVATCGATSAALGREPEVCRAHEAVERAP